MKKILILLVFVCTQQLIYSQCINNPSVQQGSISDAPLAIDQEGVFSFTYTENGLDYTDEENDPVKLTICFLNTTPKDGINSIGGGFASTFEWTYDSVLNCMLGVQIEDISGGSGGFITIDFVQTNAVLCPENQMGFNVNIQPPACMNGVNQTPDDNESVYTCVDPTIETCKAKVPVISLN